MDQQISLTPHMRQYEDFATGAIRWLPYLMFFNRPDYRSAVVNTDSGGFRISHGPAGAVSLYGSMPDGEVSLVLGASPAFGFGASSDERTLCSQLSQKPSSVPWLNLAAPGFNSTQEMVLFMLHRHQLPRVRDVVVLSGLNNLVVAGLPAAGSDYGQFFFSGEFFRQLGVPGMGQRYEQPRWALGRIAQAVRRIGSPDEPDGAAPPDPAQRIEIAVRNTVRDLDRCREVAAHAGARLHFVLQPTAAWTGKTYTREERLLIEENTAERPGMWDLFNPVLTRPVHREYAGRLAAACAERSLPFLDLNAALGSADVADEWLFVDQAHLNDEGNAAAARIIATELGLTG
ncbi:Inducer of phenazine A [Dactylosporangium roseum]|uniref:Inducer of phenazine A n=1 Tax=Dactylosporangium roseum TaxID=47989 RepID=A0ABY5ZB88_9ACTN|nr:SGNH/GDSL hydrolase family protein [Dactylosporangium roseum]UWZ39370.1 Inducer of phenazine A [Dactylosporangium roseum]